MVKAEAPRSLSATVGRLADTLLDPRSTANAASGLERFRRDLHADDAFLWVCDETRATCTLHAGRSAIANPLIVLFDEGTGIVERLRAGGTVICRDGDVSGLEPLVPSACRSYAAATARRAPGVMAVLMVTWPEGNPAVDESGGRQLRIATALLSQALPIVPLPATRAELSEAMTASVASRIALVDRGGVIVGMNAAWTEFAARHGEAFQSLSIGMNYLDICRRAAAVGNAEARAVIAGLDAVCRGSSETFSATYTCDVPGEERWWIATIAPLRHAPGGAVIEHIPLSHPAVDDLAQRLGRQEFERLAEAAPVPVWTATRDGQLSYSNDQWPSTPDAPAGRMWTEPIHPDDRERASAVFRLAVAQRRPFHAELRVRATDGSYRWWSCRAAPRYASTGELEGYVGVCSDAMMTRTWKSAFDHVAGKLVAAQESERKRIARELHDDLGQQTAVLASKLQMLAGPGATYERQMVEIKSRVQELATTIHNLSHQLHPAKLRLLGLVRTLAALCRDESLASGVAVRFAAVDVPRDLPEDIALCLFRVAQEGVRNALKHSGATTIDVFLSWKASELILQVSDNGSGFDGLAGFAGLGLLTMRERVQLVGGALSVQPHRPRGTTIRIVLPPRPEEDISSPEASSVAGGPVPTSGRPSTTGVGSPQS